MRRGENLNSESSVPLCELESEDWTLKLGLVVDCPRFRLIGY